MCTINIIDILKDKTFPKAGEALFCEITQYIDSEEKITLNMRGVDALPSMFLNTSIGRFIDEYGFDKLRDKVSFSNIGASQAQRIKEYIQKIVAAQ